MEQVMETVLTRPQVSTSSDLEALVIRLGPLKSHFSDDEFFEFCILNGDLRIEMTKEGEMIIMMPCGSEGGHRNFDLAVRFGSWVQTDGTGLGFDSSAGFTLPAGIDRAISLWRWLVLPPRRPTALALGLSSSGEGCWRLAAPALRDAMGAYLLGALWSSLGAAYLSLRSREEAGEPSPTRDRQPPLKPELNREQEA
jgi:hypothetical protein